MQAKRLVSGGDRDAKRILAALGIKEINPAGHEETVIGERKSPKW